VISVVWWWLLAGILGAAVWPLAFRLFGRLPDRGHILSKPLGLLLVGYMHWLLVSFRFLSNDWVAMVWVIALVAAASWWFAFRDGREPLAEMKVFVMEKRRALLAGEALFLLSFGLFAWLRSYYPEIMATEKPMELAFLNSILRSEHFPPHDPWLSGFAISYYYFGYLLMAMLTTLSGVGASVGFNLALALCFALAVTGAFSLSYNLVESCRRGRGIFYGMVGSGLVVFMGNLEGVFEVLHARGLGSSTFWEWLDIKGLTQAPVTGSWSPAGNWWWWRASRVIHDVVLGMDSEVIDEFPWFSFVIGDLHPHVLALPFVFVALALAFNVLLGEDSWGIKSGWRGTLGLVPVAFCLGALGFLNTWDFPIYLVIFISAYALARRMRHGERGLTWLGEVAGVGMACAALGILLYLPFYIGFRSQAGGLAFNVLVKTQLHQFLIMFGPFLLAIAGFLMADGEKWAGRWRELLQGRGLAVVVMGTLILTLVILMGFWVSVLLVGLGALACLRLWTLVEAREGDEHEGEKPVATFDGRRWALSFVLLLVIAAMGLTLAPEFVFIRDTFNSRMNTVFKFYFQAWVFLGLASTFAVFYLLEGRRTGRGATAIAKAGRYLWAAGTAALIAAGMVYTFTAIYTRANGFSTSPNLDGLAHVREHEPGEYAAVAWLNDDVDGTPVLLESVGGSYSAFGRVSARTGLPTVLGWGGHQLQWRGNYDESGLREPLVEEVYSTHDLSRASSLLDEYDVTYVYVGELERGRYPDPMALNKFSAFMDVVYEDQGVTIYRRR
jgi:YYY domain-containing protein